MNIKTEDVIVKMKTFQYSMDDILNLIKKDLIENGYGKDTSDFQFAKNLANNRGNWAYYIYELDSIDVKIK